MRLGWKLPLERMSATSLMMAIQCPEQLRQKYLLGREEKLFGDRFLGIVDHRTHEWSFKEKILTGSYPEGGALFDKFKECWDTTISEEGEPDWRDQSPTQAFQRGAEAALLYLDRVSPTVEPVAVEQRFEFTLDGIPVKFIGYVDVAEKDKIRERKTTKVKVTSPKSKWRFQARLYQMATGLPVQWDVVTRQATPQLYTADEWPDLFMPYANPDSTVRLIRDTMLRLNDLYARLGTDQPWPTTGIFSEFLCNYCAAGPRYGGDCIAWTKPSS